MVFLAKKLEMGYHKAQKKVLYMRKFKRLIRNILSVLAIIILFSVSVLIGVSLYNQGNITPENVVINEKEAVYSMYIDTTSLVELTFKESYRVCSYKGSENTCGGYRDTIVDFRLLNSKAKSEFKEKDFREMSLSDAIKIILNKENIKNVNIITNWNKTEEVINKLIYDNTDHNLSINISIDENINEELIENYIDNDKTYKVKFNSNKGSKVSTLIVSKNDTVTKPKNPTRKGYVFVEWQLNKKKYNFNKPVTKDITLKAKWKKK